MRWPRARRPPTVAIWVAVAVGIAAGVLAGRDSSEAEQAAAAPWTQVRSMPQRRSYIAAAEVDGRIYTAGGMVGESGRPLATFQRYDPEADSWTGLPILPEPIRAAAGVAIGRTIYVVGGQTASVDGGRQVYAYDVDRGAWEARAPLPLRRFNHSAVAVGGRVWVLGGYEEGAERDEVFVYDPASDSWAEGPRLPRPNHAFGAVVFRGEIWMIGGRRGEEVLREVWILDPESRRWRRGPAMPRPMELLGTAVAGDEIHAVWESTYQVYDGSGGWRDGPRPLVTRHALEAFVIGGALFTVGGCTTALRDSPVVERRSLAHAA